jgi:hypothetical protein
MTDLAVEYFFPQEPMVPPVNTAARMYRNDLRANTGPFRNDIDTDTWLYQNGITLDEEWIGPPGHPSGAWPVLDDSIGHGSPARNAGPRHRGRHRKPPPRRMRRAAGLTALMVASSVAAAGLLEVTAGHPALTGADELHATTTAPHAGAADGAAAGLAVPQPVAHPAKAYMPRHAVGTARKAPGAGRHAAPAGRHGASPSPSQPAPSPHGTTPSPTPPPTHSPTPSPTPSPTTGGGGGGSCTNPSFTTSSDFGSENLGPYTVANNMWNAGGGGITQTLSACSASSWFVKANVAEDGGGVKTYPNSHYNFANAPQISSLNSVTSTFGQASPDSGNFEDAYDIWLNGLAGAGGDEVMIWTENHGEYPAGSPVTTATFDGQAYTVWKGGNGPVSFVRDSNVSSGSVNLLEFFQWLINKGWEPANSRLEQVDYGVEIASTNGAQETFNFSNFSVSSS